MTKPEQKPAAEPRLPLRGLAMILLAVAVLFIAWGVFMLTGGAGTSETAGNATEATPNSSQVTTVPSSADTKPAQQTVGNAEAEGEQAQNQQQSETPEAAPGQGVQARTAPVHILNNSTVQGLAQRIADDIRNQNFVVADVGNLSESTFPASGVYYTSGNGNEEQTAQALAENLGITAAPRGPELEHAPSGVVLVITQDLHR